MEIGLGALIRFANAAPRGRRAIARQIAEQARSAYDPATDFWRPMRQAINRDRRTSRDGAALRQLVLDAPSRRRPSYEEISDRWRDVACRWRASRHITSAATRLDLGGVQVRVNPLFSERWADGHVETAHVWFNKEELCPDTIHGVQHLLTRIGGTDELKPVFIDMRRALTMPAIACPGDLDEWLEDLGYEFLRLAA